MNPVSRALQSRPDEARPRAAFAAFGDRWPLVLALAIPTIVWWLQRDIGLSLLDEGFVWYGAQRVLAGEVPLRDFQAYDIGRYYWYAGFMAAMDSTGILPVRAGSTVLAALTTAIAVALVRGTGRPGPVVLTLAAITFALWLVPYFKVTDSFAAMLLMAGTTALIAAPGVRNALACGVCLGVASTIGINHALYGVVGIALAAGYVAWRDPAWRPARAAAAFALGAGIGYLPVLACMALVPGFAAGFVDSVRLLAETGTTNLDLGIPALRMPTDAWSVLVELRSALIAVAYVALPGFLLVAGWRLWRRRGAPAGDAPPAPFVAGLLLAVPYAHYAYSRWDVTHLAVSALPVMLAVWTFPTARPARSVAATLWLVTLATLLVAGPDHAFFQTVRGTALQPVQVAGETLRVPERTAAELRLLDETIGAHAPPPRSIYVAPYWPGAYAVAGRRSPTWEIYLIFPLSERRQRLEIERLAAADVALALVSRSRMDGRDDLGFARTHALIAEHLRRCMAPLAGYTSPVRGVEVRVGPLPQCRPAPGRAPPP